MFEDALAELEHLLAALHRVVVAEQDGLVALEFLCPVDAYADALCAVAVGGSLEVEEEAADPLVGPFSGKPVAFYELRVEEYRRGSKGGRWVKRHASTSSDPFYLEDDTGRVLVLPDGVKTHLPVDYRKTCSGSQLPESIQGYLDRVGVRSRFLGMGRRLRLTERHIVIGQSFYLHGIVRERPDLRERKMDRMHELLRDVKNDADRMRQIDVDGDGQVDALEWDAARRGARRQLEAEGVEDRIVVMRGGRRDLFLLSDRSEVDLVTRLRWETGLWIFGGGAAFVAGTAYAVHGLTDFF